jgi:hypothetical protein
MRSRSELPPPFQGLAWALSPDGLGTVSAMLGVNAPEIWTVLAVETSACGFLPDQRPQILFERHTFHRLTEGKYDDGDISDAKAGGYGAGGAHQYKRLERAIQKDRNAALQSTSWGIGQILGANYAEAGFADVDAMVLAMCESEDRQITAMGRFLAGSGLHRALRAHDWATFARGYNGPDYLTNRYDTRLNAEFQKYTAGALPELNQRAVQLYLTYLGLHPGPVDGVAGTRTLAALAEFQVEHGFAVDTNINPAVVAQLRAELGGRAGKAESSSSLM